MTKVVFDESGPDCVKIGDNGKNGFSKFAESLKIFGAAAASSKATAKDYSKDANVLVISFQTNNTKPEDLAAMRQFVENGGGLLVLGEWGATGSSEECGASKVAKLFEIVFNEDRIMTKDVADKRVASDYLMIDKFRIHPITRGVKSVAFSAACSVNLPKDKILAWTPELSFADKDMNQQWDINEEFGRLAIAGCAEVGKGRVVAIGDVSFATNEFIGIADNKAFAVNAVKWLAKRI